MVRPSSLQIARHCQLSPVLNERYPHTNANIARGNEVDAQVTAWVSESKPPTDPAALDATRWIERHLELARAQVACDLVVAGVPVTHGTADLVGRDTWDAGLLIVADLKKRDQWIAGKLAQPDDNLQLHAYALAQALAHGFQRYRVVILLVGDETVQDVWSREYTSVEWTPILEEIQNICAQKPDDGKDPIGTAGDHCLNCYPRVHCGHWALPAYEGGDSALAALSDTQGLTPVKRGRALLAIKAMRELCDRGEEILKAQQRAAGPGSVVIGEKEWRPTIQHGRKSADVAALEAAGLHQYVKQGPPFETWRLTKLR